MVSIACCFPETRSGSRGGEWKAVLLADSDREAYLASLSRLMDLHFDILVPWGSEEGQPYGYGVTRLEAQKNLRRIIDRLRAGGSG